jgi:glycosyltransferase involved in cell wall biosynthesis
VKARFSDAYGRELSVRSGTGTPAAANRVRVLTFTTLFPNEAQPRHGIFVETRMHQLVASGSVEARVVAPVPWFPLAGREWGRYGAYARAPHEETRGPLLVAHPRYLAIPRIGRQLHPKTLYLSALPVIERWMRGGFDFDLIDAHYLYPDGVAASSLAARFAKPLVISARGTDVNVLARQPAFRERIVAAAAAAAKVVAVSAALKRTLIEVGIDADKIVVLRNGVDLDRFRPRPRGEARQALGLGAGPVLAAIANLVPEKGLDLFFAALARIPTATGVVVGEGPAREKLNALARKLRIESRVRFLSNMPQSELATVYSAADIVVLTSIREGWPNVLLEANACGTPVVAMDVGGVREIVTSPDAGRVVAERDPSALSAAALELLAAPPDAAAVRRHAEQFSWRAVVQGQLAVLRGACGTETAVA